jgi:hypothetical protein
VPRKPVAILCPLQPDHLDQAFGGPRALLVVGKQRELKRQGVTGLGVADHPAVSGDVLVVKCPADAVGEVCVPGRVGRMAQ